MVPGDVSKGPWGIPAKKNFKLSGHLIIALYKCGVWAGGEGELVRIDGRHVRVLWREMDTCAHVGWPVFAHVGPAVDQQLGSLGVFNCIERYFSFKRIWFLILWKIMVKINSKSEISANSHVTWQAWSQGLSWSSAAASKCLICCCSL